MMTESTIRQPKSEKLDLSPSSQGKKRGIFTQGGILGMLIIFLKTRSRPRVQLLQISIEILNTKCLLEPKTEKSSGGATRASSISIPIK